MTNQQNIDPYKFKKGCRTSEEQRKIAKIGGIASGEAKREKKLFKQILEEQLSKLNLNGKSNKEMSIEKIFSLLSSDKIKPNDYIRVMEFIRDTVGEKPTEKVENINPQVVINNQLDVKKLKKLNEKLK